MPRTPRVAIYARVSTSDKGQDPEVQLTQLRKYVAQRQWEVAGEFTDHGISGSEIKRPRLAQLRETVHRHTCDVVLVWKLDRLGRSVLDLVHLLDEFRRQEVEFVSYTDQIDTTTPTGKLMFHMLAAIAQFERDLIIERTRAGLDYARSQGKVLGRPRLDVDRAAIVRDHARGSSIRQLAREYRVSVGSVANIIHAAAERRGPER